MREDDAPVGERRLAARAAGRVADRLRDGSADGVIVDPEEDLLSVAPEREIRDEWIVGIEHEDRFRR